MSKRTKNNPAWQLPGERISEIERTVGVNFGRVAVRLPSMAWLACPRCNEAPCACERAAEYEARRAAIIAAGAL